MRCQKVPGGVQHQLSHFLVERGGARKSPSCTPLLCGLILEIHHASDQNRMPLKVMKCLSELLLLCVATSLSLLLPAWAFSQGAKPSSCVDMEPGHIRAQPQDPHRSHVTLHTTVHSYLPGDTVTVAVRSTRDFMGFLLQARTVHDDHIAGSFVLIPPGSRALSCLEAGDTITHSDKLLKRNLSFVWRAPDRPLGDVRFLITVVQSYFVYWARIESAVVHDGTMSLDGDDAGGGGTLPGPRADTTSLPSSVQPSDRLSRMEEEEEEEADEEEEEEPGISSMILVAPGKDLTIPSPPIVVALPTAPPTFSASSPLTLPPGLAHTGTKSQRASSDPQPCSRCDQGGQISVKPGPEEYSPLTSSTDTPAGPGQPERSPLTAPDPETQATPTSPHPGPSPAPRRSHSDPVTRAAPPQHTPPPGVRVQKGMVARNLSKGGEAGQPKEGGAGGGKEEESPGARHKSALELGVLLGCSAGLGMVLAVGLRYLHSQYCLKRTAVSLSERDGSIIHVQDSGELVQIRKIRQNSFVLLQAEYDVMTPPGN